MTDVIKITLEMLSVWINVSIEITVKWRGAGKTLDEKEFLIWCAYILIEYSLALWWFSFCVA